MELNRVLVGNALDVLKTLPDNSISCAITSPPYYALRYYGLAPVPWPEVTYSPMPGLPPITIPAGLADLGLEPDPWAFVGHLVAIFREVRRVLHPSGCAWVNLGDSYATSANGRSAAATKAIGNDDRTFRDKPFSTVGNGLKPKDLIGIPWRVALALQADGWWLRSDVIWAKPNPMPESVTDRPTKAHEYVFLLSRSERYFWDQEAVREPHSRNWWNETVGAEYMTAQDGRTDGGKRKGGGTEAGRNLRTIWEVTPKPYKSGHFATFPERLAEICLLAGSSEYGVCAECGAPWERVVEKDNPSHKDGSTRSLYERGSNANRMSLLRQAARANGQEYTNRTKTLGWRKACQCSTNEVKPAVILDPFLGSGTVARVAIRHRRAWLGIELNETYAADLVSERVNGTQIRLCL